MKPGILVALYLVIRIVSMTLQRIIKGINVCEVSMIPLLFILMVTWLSILLSCHFSPEITWFTYYMGAVIGLFASGLALDFWNKRNRRDLEVTEIRREI
jgi:hypothetical protein